MRRLSGLIVPVVLSLVGAGCGVSAAVRSRQPDAQRIQPAAARLAPGRWGTTTALVKGDVQTGFPQVALAPGGQALAAWIQGPPPEVTAGPASGAASTSVSPIQEVVADRGSVQGGFRTPRTLSEATSGSLSSLTVAMSGRGSGYLAWEQGIAIGVYLAVLDRSGVAAAAHLVRKNAVPLGLFPLRQGKAALVWDQYGHGFPILEYGRVDRAGRLSGVTRVAHLNGHDQIPTQISVNSRGVLAAAWTNGGGTALRHGKPVAVTAHLIAVTCKPFTSCSALQTIPLGRTRPTCINPAVAVSPDGTTHVLAAANDQAPRGCDRPLGLWETNGSPGGRLRRAVRLSSRGDWPVAALEGRGGAVAAFNPAAIPADTLAWLTLGRASQSTRPRRLPDRDTVNTPVVSGTEAGSFLIAWEHASSHSNPRISVRAVLGAGHRVGRATGVVPARDNVSSFSAAVDGAGDGILIWNQARQSANANGNFGVFVRRYRTR